MSALGLAALEVARRQLAAGVRGGVAPYARFRSARIDEYMRAVGLAPHEHPCEPGWPWCAAAVRWCFWSPTSPNPCPRTASALRMWELADAAVKRQLAAPGDVFVLDRGNGRGHVGFVAAVSPGGRELTTVEPDASNVALTATGDAWGEHVWTPGDGIRGRLVGYLEL